MVCVMDQAVQNGIGEGGVADDFMPVLEGELRKEAIRCKLPLPWPREACLQQPTDWIFIGKILTRHGESDNPPRRRGHQVLAASRGPNGAETGKQSSP